MRPAPETLSLGGKSWLLRPLTLRQVQEIEPISLSISRGDTGQIAGIVKLLAIMLHRDHPGEVEGLPDLEATVGEIKACMAVIMRLSGLVEAEAPDAGEVQAAPAA